MVRSIAQNVKKKVGHRNMNDCLQLSIGQKRRFLSNSTFNIDVKGAMTCHQVWRD